MNQRDRELHFKSDEFDPKLRLGRRFDLPKAQHKPVSMRN